MKNKKSISISIDKPCAECWDSMLPNDLGRYCPVCKTDILDFTDLNDLEIIQILEHTEGKVCGRFQRSQLNRPLIDIVGPKQKPTSRFARMAIAVELLYSSGNIVAQDNHAKETIDLPSLETDSILPKVQQAKISNNVLDGKVYCCYTNGDEDPLIGVTVVIKGTTIGTVTDIKGEFKILVPDHLMKKEEVTFIFKYLGFQSLYLKYKTTEIPKERKTIYMKEDENMLIGEVVVVRYYGDPIYDRGRRKK